MCTIIVRHQMNDGSSTVIASNRDEFYDRVASGPTVLLPEPLVVGGRDEQEGGTWFGLNREGLFVGLTNQRNFGARDESLQSRGSLVIEALAQGSLEGAKRYLDGIDPGSFNEFNLLFGDGEQVCAAYGRRGARRIEIDTLGAGVHVLCNDRIGSPEFPKADKARARVMAIPAQPWPRLRDALAEVLADGSLPETAELPPLPAGAPFDREVARRLQAIYVQTPVYGTVSSTIAAVSPGRVDQYQFTDRLPTSESFEDRLSLTRNVE
jgi:uncharacterized protein with NRDE domain